MTNATATQANATPGVALRFARHLVGVSALLAVNPFHGVLGNWVSDWLQMIGGLLLVCGLVWALYALFFTARARRHWPRSFFLLLWVFAGLSTLGYWGDYYRVKSPKPSATNTAPTGIAPAGKVPWEDFQPLPATPQPEAQPQRWTSEQEQSALQQAANSAVARFPYLNTEGGSAALQLIMAERDRRIALGERPSDALNAAVNLIAPQHEPR